MEENKEIWQNDQMIQNPPKKVLAMYQAVIEMINEEYDMNAIKVIDITSRAGIGKGTAYEYFSNKEEIIVKALFYDTGEKIESVAKVIDTKYSFEQKVMKILDFVKENYNSNRTFCQLVKLGMGAYDTSENMKREYSKIQNNCAGKFLGGLIDRLMEQGFVEGIIEEESVLIRRAAFGSQIVMYAMLLNAQEDTFHFGFKEEGLSDKMCQRKVYDSIVRIL